TLRIDDKKHQEQIYVHAQKDLDYYIRNDKRESIGHQRHRIVQGSAYDHIENNQHRTIGKDHNLQIDGQQSRSIGQSMEQKIGQNYREHAAVEYHLKAGAGVVLDAGQSLTLKAAGSSVVLDETGVSVTGLMVLINSGGGAGSAKGASASAPKTSEPVDPGHAGSPIPSLGADARFKNAPVEFEPAAFSAIEKPKDITPTQGEGFGADDALSLSLDLIPGVGTAKGVVELIAGFDPVTGEEIPRWISTAALAASIIPGGKAAVRGARTAGKMAKHADEAVDVGEAVVKHGDEVEGVAGKQLDVDGVPEKVVPGNIPSNSAATPAHNAANFIKHKELLSVTESANPLVDSLRATGHLPSNYVSKSQAIQQGWKPGKALSNSVPSGQLGGDVFQNSTNILPSVQGRVWHEADVGLNSTVTRAKQPGTRLLYSNDGLLYVTPDHYETVHMIGRWKD
ncbi:bacteriophage T4 gp5 trimerisation domain-containing protein, partial [Ketobacter sp.]